MEKPDYGLLDGGESMGMSDAQYKGFLRNHLDDLQEILELATAAGNTEIQEKVEKKIKRIEDQLAY